MLCNDKSGFCSFTLGKLTGCRQLLACDKKPFAAGWLVLLLCGFHLLLVRGSWAGLGLDKVSSETTRCTI